MPFIVMLVQCTCARLLNGRSRTVYRKTLDLWEGGKIFPTSSGVYDSQSVSRVVRSCWKIDDSFEVAEFRDPLSKDCYSSWKLGS